MSTDTTMTTTTKGHPMRKLTNQTIRYAEIDHLIGTDEWTLVNATGKAHTDMPAGPVDLVLDEHGVVVHVVETSR